MLSGVELHLPRQIVAPAASTTHTEVCSRETSSPTYCCCFMVVLRFVTTEAPMLKAHLLPRLPDVPTRALTRLPRAVAVKDGRLLRPPEGLVLDGREHGGRLVCVAIDGCCMMPVFVVNR